MDKTAERVGNPASAKDGHFGVTGWQKKHMTINGSKITVKYVGKSGVKQDKSFTDKRLATMLKKCMSSGGKTLLTTGDGVPIGSAQVNRYLKDFGITAKDIRGYRANDLMVKILKATKTPSTPEERKKTFKEAIKEVAAAVGHQQATLKQHYLLPGVEESYIKSGSVKKVKNASIGTRIAQIAEDVGDFEVLRSRAVSYAQEIIPILEDAYRKYLCDVPVLQPVSVVISDDLPEDKIGSYRHPQEGEAAGVLTISPRAFESDHWQNVVLHELIHAILGEQADPHCKEFDILSKVMGLPEEFRD